jgi:phosphoribosylformimino-5-aminoimidazole carboxamide ribotide isomerase
MIIYPAIDIKDSKCVRLFQGDMNQVTIFNDSPLKQAQFFKESGFNYLHIVDLDGAVAGKSVNHEAVKEIIDNVDLQIQLGGGIRSMANIEFWLNLGVTKVIIGTAALKDPELVIRAAQKFPQQIIVGIDAKDNYVQVSGWVEDSKIKVIDLAKKFEDAGVNSIIYTDISRDGTLFGPNIENTVKLAQNISIPVIASGGISNIDDVKQLKEQETQSIKGVIIGRAIYDKKINLSDLQNMQS